MRQLYPPIDPLSMGHLEVGDGHALYFEESGNRDGIPVLFLHGGPGSSCNASHHRYFDPARYRAILFDQRGCGRSRPRGGDAHNTTQALVADIERLRNYFDVDRWLLFGGSWGSTLALSYAQTFPGRILGMVLRGIFLASEAELQWYCEGLRAFVPEAWERFTRGITEPSTQRILGHYSDAMRSSEAVTAAQRWTAYESAIMAIGEASGGGGVADTSALTDRARVQLHFLRNGCFLPTPLIDGCADLRMPSIIVQGRRDLVCPPRTAYALHTALPGSEFVMVEEGGHSAMHPAMIDALVRATDAMADRLGGRP